MPRRKSDGTRTFLQREVPKMPEGYYSGDKPNPNLRAFVEAHLRELAERGEMVMTTLPDGAVAYELPPSDSYDVPPFDKPIETTKRTAIYNMHSYHQGKKPHDAIRQYIRHYTKPGDLVLDPFCGSGGTALAALMEGRKAIATDRSPAATFITKNYCTPVDVEELQAAFEELKAKVKPEIDWLYETRCDRCGGKATTGYTVYSQVFQCPRCLEKIPLFDCVQIDATTAQGKPKKVNVCPYCQEKGHDEVIRSQSEKFGAIPVLVSYLCQNGCKPARGQRRHNDPDDKKREYFEKYDLGKIREIEGREIPYWYPRGFDMTKFSRYQRDALFYYGVSEVADLFTERNLWALAAFLQGIETGNGNDAACDWIRGSLTGIILGLSRMNRYRPDVSFPLNVMNGTYYLPQISKEEYVFKHAENKVDRVGKGIVAISNERCSSLVYVSTDDAARSVRTICESSIDYIFTDPPYGGTYQYGELNFVWEAWLGFDTHWHDDEIIVNPIRGKTEEDWANAMRLAMAECYRVLKPGRALSLCYHDTSEGTWALIQDIMAAAGFVPEVTDAALYIDTGQKSYNQLTADKVTKRDLIINFRKPKHGGSATAVLGAGGSDASIEVNVRAIIREYLTAHPGATKDHIYDEAVSRLVRAGKMAPHDFDLLLEQVAECDVTPRMANLFERKTPDLFGGHEMRRWRLKESEEGSEEAERALQDQAAARIRAFIVAEADRLMQRGQTEWEILERDIADLESQIAEAKRKAEAEGEDHPEHRARPKKPLSVLKRLREKGDKRDKIRAERDEWAARSLHYTYIFETYAPMQPKPRATLTEILEDYFIQTDAGNWRPPANDAEAEAKAEQRGRAERRHIRWYCRAVREGAPIPPDRRPDDATLAEWVRACKRAGMYEEGRFLYERGGLNPDNLGEEAAVNVEEDYRMCVKRMEAAGRERDKQTRNREGA